MSPDPGDEEGRSYEISEALDEVARRLDRLEKRDLSQARILVHLLERNRSVADLVADVYGKNQQDADYRRLYMRISRRLDSLQERGLVSRALFGKERPYRVTRLGRRTLTLTIARRSPGRREQVEGVWGKPQSAVVVSTGLLLIAVLLLRPSLVRLILAYAFFLAMGLSIGCAAYTLREVL